MIRTSCILAVVTLWSSPAFAQKVGDTVTVIRECDIKVGSEVVDQGFLGLSLTVSAVNGKWLWVNNAIPGWIDRSNVVLLHHAIPHFTELIRRTPNASAYRARGIVLFWLREYDKAIDDVSESIRLAPSEAGTSYSIRGACWSEKKEWERAIADLNMSIKLDPGFAAIYNRGLARLRQQDYDRAIADFDLAILQEPLAPYFYQARGRAWVGKGEYEKAIDDFSMAIRLDPKHGTAFSASAFLRATCPDVKFRDGQKAVRNATTACQLSGWKEPIDIDALAAAYAEIGKFDEAVRWEQTAFEMALSDKKEEYRCRLNLYKSGKPYRTEPK